MESRNESQNPSQHVVKEEVRDKPNDGVKGKYDKSD